MKNFGVLVVVAPKVEEDDVSMPMENCNNDEYIGTRETMDEEFEDSQ